MRRSVCEVSCYSNQELDRFCVFFLCRIHRVLPQPGLHGGVYTTGRGDSDYVSVVRPDVDRAVRQDRLRVHRVLRRRHRPRPRAMFRSQIVLHPRAGCHAGSGQTVQWGPQELSGCDVHLHRWWVMFVCIAGELCSFASLVSYVRLHRWWVMFVCIAGELCSIASLVSYARLHCWWVMLVCIAGELCSFASLVSYARLHRWWVSYVCLQRWWVMLVCIAGELFYYFLNMNFVSSHYVPREPRRDPSNCRFNEHGIYIWHCQESNSQPSIPSQVRADPTRPQWRSYVRSHHITHFHDVFFRLILSTQTQPQSTFL